MKKTSKKLDYRLLTMDTTISSIRSTKGTKWAPVYSYIVTLKQGTGTLADWLSETSWVVNGEAFDILLTDQHPDVKNWHFEDPITLMLSPSKLANYVNHDPHAAERGKKEDWLLTPDEELWVVPAEEMGELGFCVLIHPINQATTSDGSPTVSKDAVVAGKDGANLNNSILYQMAADLATKEIAKAQHSEFELIDYMEGWPKVVAIPNITPPSEIMRIGYTAIDVPMASFLFEKQSHPVQIPMVRGAGSVKRGVGAALDRYTFYYQVQGYDDVKNNVVGVLNQLLHTPFLPIDGIAELELVDALAIKNFSIATVAGQPDALQIQITAEPFLWNQYCYTLRGVTFEDTFCWPLFKMWCETKGKRSYIEDQGDGRWSNGRLIFQFPDQGTAREIEEAVTELGTSPNIDQSVFDFWDQAKIAGPLSESIVKKLGTFEGLPVRIVTDNKGKMLSTDRLVVAMDLDNKEAFEAVINSPYCFGIYPRGTTPEFMPQSPDERNSTPIPIVKYIFPDTVFSNKFTSPESLAAQLRMVAEIRPLAAGTKTETEGAEFTDTKKSLNPANDKNERLRDLWKSKSLLVMVDINDPTQVGFMSGLRKYTPKTTPVKESTPTNQNAIAASIFNEQVTKKQAQLELEASNSKSKVEAWVSFQKKAPTFAIATENNTNRVIIEEISVSREHNLTHHQLREYSLPSHQYMGTSDALIQIRGTIFDLATIKQLQLFFDTSNTRSRQPLIAKNKDDGVPSYDGYARIENDVCGLMGVDFVLPISLSIQARENEPSAWDFTMTLVEYDHKTQSQETIRQLPTWLGLAGKVIDFNGNNPPWVETTREYFEVENCINSHWEPYGDMSLPTWGEVDNWIRSLKRLSEGKGTASDAEVRKHCNLWTKLHKNEIKALEPSRSLQGWADPDFYMGYWKQGGKDKEAVGVVVQHELLSQTFGNKDQEKEDAPPKKAAAKEAAVKNLTKKKDTRSFYDALAQPTNPNPDQPWRLTDGVGTYGIIEGKLSSQQDTTGLHPSTNPTLTLDPSIIAEQVMPQLNGPEILKSREESFRSFIGEVAAKDPIWGAKILAGAANSFPEDLLALGGAGVAIGESQSLNTLDYAKYVACGTDFQWTAEQTHKPGEEPVLRDKLDESIKDILFLVDKCAAEAGGNNIVAGYKSNDLKLPDVFAVNKDNPLDKTEIALPTVTTNIKSVDPATGANIDTPGGPVTVNNTGYASVENFYAQLWSGRTGTISYMNASLNDFMSASQRNAIFRKVHVPRSNAIASQNLDGIKGQDLLFNNVDACRIVQQTAVVLGVDSMLLRAIMRTSDDANPAYASTDKKRTGVAQLTIADRTIYKSPNGVREDIIVCAKKYRALLDKWKTPVLALYAYRLGDKVLSEELYKAAKLGLPGKKGKNITILAKDADAVRTGIVSAIPDDPRTFYRNLANAINRGSNSDAKEAAMFVHNVYHQWKALSIAHGVDPADAGGNDLIFGRRNLSLYAPKGLNNSVGKTAGQTDAFDPVDETCPETPMWNYDIWSVTRADDSGGTSVNQAVPILSEKDMKLAYGVWAPATARGMVGVFKDSYEFDFNARLVNAFPNYLMLFIDEGSTLGRIKMWDHYYIRGGVASIEINHSKERPTGVAQVTLSNLFGRLSSQSVFEQQKQEILTQAKASSQKGITADARGLGSMTMNVISEAYQLYFNKIVPEWMIRGWQNHVNRIAIQAGTRLHVRLGYGSNPKAMPICFNGTISEMPVHDGMITFVALSDGAEMTNPITHSLTFDEGHNATFQQQAQFGGKEPAAIMHDLFSARGMLATLTAGAFESSPNAGLSHWGSMWYIGSVWPSPMNRYNPTEIQINMYTSSPNLERNYAIWRNFFNVNALYNYENVNLIGVKVKEPTPWRVCQVLRKAVFEYIAYPYPFQFRHTMFYGNRFYPLYYRYNTIPLASPLTKNLGSKASALDLSTNNAVPITNADAFNAGTALAETIFESSEPEPIFGYTPPPEDNSASWSVEKKSAAAYIKSAWDLLPIEIKNRLHPVGNEPKASGADIANRLAGIDRTTGEKSDITEDWFVVHYWEFQPERGILIAKRIMDLDAELIAAGNKQREFLTQFVSTLRAIKFTKETKILTLFPNVEPGGLLSGAPGPGMLGGTIAVTANTLDQPGNIEAYNDPEWLSQFMDWKPFCQVHFVDGGLNLIANEVIASDEHVYTNATGVYDYAGLNLFWLNAIADKILNPSKSGNDYVCQTRSYSIDTDIVPHYQRTMLVDTGIYTDWMMSGKYSIIGVSQVAASQGLPATPSVENAVVTSLIDTVKQMYQGWLIVQGSGTYWPHHLIYISDARTNLNGVAGIREVNQHFSVEMGFVTGIAPECIAISRSSQHETLWLSSIQAYCIKNVFTRGILRLGTGLWRAGAYGDRMGRYHELESLVKTVQENESEIVKGAMLRRAEKMEGEFAKDIEEKLIAKRLQYYNNLITLPGEPPRYSLEDLHKWHPDEIKRAQESARELAKRKVGKIFTVGADRITDIYNLGGGGTLMEEILAQAWRDPEVAIIADVQRLWDKIQLGAAKAVDRKAYIAKTMKGLSPETLNKFREAIKIVQKINPQLAEEGKFLYLQTAVNKVLKNKNWINTFAKGELLSSTSEVANIAKKVKQLEKTAREAGGLALDIEINGTNRHMLKDVNEETLHFLEAKLAKKDILVDFKREGKDVIYSNIRTSNPITNIPGASVGLTTAETDKMIELAIRLDGKEVGIYAKKVVSNKIMGLGQARTSIKRIAEVCNKIRTNERAAENLKTVMSWLNKVRSGEGMLLSATTGQFEILACQIAFQTVQVMIVDTFMEAINDYFLSRQVALIYPLKVGFVPLLAGVLGHQGCVVGDQPGMLDKMIGGMTGGGIQEGTDDGWGYLTTVLNFVGLQAINYGNVIPQDEGD